MKILYYSMSDKGQVREHNEDSYLNNELFSVFMVADGMGGYQCGDVASRIALESVISYLETCCKKDGTFTERAFKYAIEYSNRRVFNYKKKNPQIKEMGTTLVGFVPSENGGVIFNVGDSRLYHYKNNELIQITKDHSAEQEVLPDFMQNMNEGKYSGVITQALGIHEMVKYDTYKIQYAEGDLLLLCTDGLHSMISPDAIRTILDGKEDIQKKTAFLVDAANQAGGKDNITVTLIEILSTADPYTIEYKI
ncbi:MAG: serine/threonine-protein phosphatase [Candidatus Aureabacteria bacterium]|nr:serine/threonine-protein phosphatase [Candidatus Auribacterota bacterium]